MCRKLCCIFSSSLAVILSLFFSSPPFCNVTKKTGPPSLPCQYQYKAYKDSDELQLMVSSSPSWIIRDWGLCCNFWVWTPVQKDDVKKAQKAVIRSQRLQQARRIPSRSISQMTASLRQHTIWSILLNILALKSLHPRTEEIPKRPPPSPHQFSK